MLRYIVLLLSFISLLFANLPPQITYNENHQPLVVEYEDGSVAEFDYSPQEYLLAGSRHALNRLATVTDAQGTVSYDYDAIGRQTKVYYPNGVVTEYRYDAKNRVTNITHKNSNGDTLRSFAYTYDATGNRLSEIRDDGRKVAYEYNEVGQLTKEVVTDDPNGNNTTTTYTYDLAGNLVTKTIDASAGSATKSYTYDANDRLTQTTSTGSVTDSKTFTYDANGNLIDDGTDTYEYDDKNRLVKATTPNGIIEYEYDAEDHRIAKIVEGTTTTYLVDTNTPYAQVITESKENGTQIHYTYGNDLLSDGRQYFLTDALGSTRGLVDSAETLTDTYDYKPYGEIVSHTGNSDNEFMFTGEQYDIETDNYYLRARYYSPSFTRFLSRDTYDGKLIDPLSQNHYLYASGNPIIYVDHSGHMTMMGLIGAIRNLGILAARATLSFGRRAYRNFKRRRWTIYKVEEGSGFGLFEHTFIWAVNHKKRKGLGFHVYLPNGMRTVVRHGGRSGFSPGLFGVFSQRRVNFYGGKIHRVRKTFITKLAPLAFGVWRFSAAMNVREGGSCYFSYSPDYNSCKHWSDRAVNTARLLTLLPF